MMLYPENDMALVELSLVTPSKLTVGMTNVPAILPRTMTIMIMAMIMNQSIQVAQSGKQQAQHMHRIQQFRFSILFLLGFFSPPVSTCCASNSGLLSIDRLNNFSAVR